MSRVVIAGGSGLIGSALAKAAELQGHEVVILSRHPKQDAGSVRYVAWDGKTAGAWTTEVDGAEAVINLSGENIGKHWTEDYKLKILQSRLDSTAIIGKAIQDAQQPPKVWINGSAIGIYGNRGDEAITEGSLPGPKGDFLVDTVVAWEAEVDRFAIPQTKKIKIRTGHVLSREGGLLKPLYMVTKFFLGGPLGNGRQYMSWIHREDHVRAMLWLVKNGGEGIYNLTAPDPATNSYLMAMLRGVMRRPWAPPVPLFALKVVEWLGGPPASLALEGQKVLPARLESEGFEFKYPKLREALVDLTA